MAAQNNAFLTSSFPNLIAHKLDDLTFLLWLQQVKPVIKSHRLQHFHGYLKDIRSQRWKMWWISLTWCIWFHRNKIVFSNETFNGQKMMDDAIFFYWVWLKNLEKRFNISFQYWASNIRIGFCNHGWISI